ncbi:MAG: CinA family protein [Candidatus Dadabacteria bacterium]|nr:MAG: CinA family protein [Candidatus Dadabacteria bacterium]
MTGHPPEVRLAAALVSGGGPLAVAESCTGGLIAHRITRVPGSSAYFDRGLVVYSNRAKVELLGVPEDLLETHGAVSEACARAMLEGLFRRSPARLGAAVTGIAGPTGGTPEKPVGTVWVAWGRPGRIRAERLRLRGERTEIQEGAAEAVLQRLAREAETPWTIPA